MEGNQRVRVYRGECVWIREANKRAVFRLEASTIIAVNLVNPKQPKNVKSCEEERKIRFKMKSLERTDIVNLMGICVDASPVIAVFEYFSKSSLHELLSSDASWIDSSLQFSLLGGILRVSLHKIVIRAGRNYFRDYLPFTSRLSKFTVLSKVPTA